jgi:hypothetical protein
VSDWRISGLALEKNMSQWLIAEVKNFLPDVPVMYFTDEAHEAKVGVK